MNRKEKPPQKTNFTKFVRNKKTGTQSYEQITDVSLESPLLLNI